MKKQISWGIPLGIFVLAFVAYSFFYWPPPTLSVHINENGATDNKAAFELTDLPTISGTGSHFRIMLSHGDGTYFLGTLAELAAHRHTYTNQQSSYSAFADVVAAYDDKKKPPKRTNILSVPTVNNGTSVPSNNAQLMLGKKVLLRKNTTAVPGDSITYMITYEHNAECTTEPLNGVIRFRYDGGKFEFKRTDSYFSETETQSSGNVDLGFSNLILGEQRSVFVLLKTNSNATTGAILGPVPNAELVLIRSNGDTCRNVGTIYRDSILGQTIASSHDPNFKTVVENQLCTGESVSWRIDFQNEGDTSESTVVISDWIDTLLDYESVSVIGSKFQVAAQRYNPANREWRFEMAGLNLRGLGERGVPEEDTKGHIVIRAKKRAQARCSAAANSARILFGCNPPVFTDVALAEFPCDTSCTCSTLKDTTLPTLNGNAGDTLISWSQFADIFDNSLPSSNWSYKWYPALGLSDPFAPTPTLISPVNRTYTLVASSSVECIRVVVHVPVRPPTPLGINIDKNCSGNTWDITATATGRGPEHLIWNRCDKWVGSNTLPPSNQPRLQGDQKVYFGVWDTMTDQVAEEWVLLPLECPTVFPPWVYVALALLLAMIAAWFYMMRRR